MTEVKDLGVLMQGNEACAAGALAAGAKFFAGYPITPSTEVAEILAAELPKVGGKFIQMEDEIAGMAAVIGASLAGLKSITATSGPGFSLKQENLGFAIMTEVPCVVLNVQRGGPSTGVPTAPAQGDVMQARWGTHGDHPIITLAPASVKETFEATVKAFNLSEKFRIPVILLMDEVIGHMRERVQLPRAEEIEVVERKKPDVGPESYYAYKDDETGVPPMANFGDGYRYHVTGLVHDETGFPSNNPERIKKFLDRLHNKLADNADEIIMVDETEMEDAEIVIFAYGSVGRSAKKAVKELRKKGIKAGLFRPITIWPFPVERLKQRLGGVKALVVPEMNMGQLVGEVERVAAGKVPVIPLNRYDGELITPAEIVAKVQEVL
ncbi:2-oxoacid:acceptor oxidoreductase subunit alpha [Metallumcola ferriviriculae]|uniref:2-oxoacid:acceptor oxidoreductase subunit alpha n=1 Tax=Metallumcola ferriviriculae TaxID=3039180 RepID=A0AAU0UT77_9FIRM|nr:2-oxoacid:acceptor oxidoreductase subunit alpha [Desulfitibacteraceae bacterium MK1]